MPITDTVSATWTEFARLLLEKGSDSDQQAILNTIGAHEGLTPLDADLLLPIVTELLLDPDPHVRYFARKARNKLDQQVSPQRRAAELASEAKKDATTDTVHLTRQEILLNKMRLGSRYVAFEAIDRLIESEVPSLAGPMLEFLAAETDLFKISFLVKRLPRLNDPRIPAALEPFLRHHDPRVVANTLEGLSLCRTPHLRDEFVRLTASPDNRVKAAAVRTLYAYEPHLAERRIQDMLENPSIAMQDSGVYLLRTIRPPRLNALMEIPLSSKFPSIRLLALEIPKHSHTLEVSEPTTTGTPLTIHYADKGLISSLLVATFLVMTSSYFSEIQSFLILLVLGAALASTAKNRPSSLLRAVISTGIIACGIWGDGTLLAVPALLAVWHPAHHSEDDRLPRISAWTFALIATLLAQLITGFFPELADIAARAGVAGAGPIGDFRAIAAQDARFAGFIFTIVATASYILLHINEWYSSPQFRGGNTRRLLIFFALALGAVILMSFGRLWNLRFNLVSLGVTDPIQLFRLPGK
ncbi:MAG: HEAT repeat protein [bacterium ADurb.Bin374]|nr:MAG: HEAT repeat protein [bacterium ADurb.Bin374]